MSKNAEFVSHKKSKQKIDGKPQLPEASMLREGEIAINFAKGVETLSIKNESGDVVTFSSDNYYTEQKLGSGFTGANSGVTVTEVIENIPGSVVDQVIDSGTSASTNAVATKAVYDVITDNELVWTNAFVTLSGITSAHTANTEIHVTAADKEKLHTHSNKTALDSITGNVGTMAYQNTNSYSSATEVNTALSGKANTATTYTKTEVDARDLWVSGTGVNSVVQKNGQNIASGNYSVAEGNQTSATSISTHAEGKETQANANYSHAEGIRTTAGGSASHAEGQGTQANATGSHAEGTSTQANVDNSHAEGSYTIANNHSEHASGRYNVSSSASTDFGDSGNTLFSVGNGTADNARHNAFEIRQNGDIYITSGNSTVKLQDNLGVTIDQVIDSGTSASTNAVSTKAVYDVISDNEYVTAQALNDLETNKLDVTAYTPTDLTNYYTKSETSGATEISNALGGKINTATFTGHTADTTVHHTSTSAVTSGSTDVITSGGVYEQMDGVKLKKITQSAYDQLQTKDPNTLYIITD